MADDGHYYLVNGSTVTPCHDLTKAQARKRGCYASVTTKRDVLSNSYLDKWRLKRLILESEQNPRLPNEDDDNWIKRIDNILWGQPTRWDGVKFQSWEFGTSVHAELENWNLDHGYAIRPEWEPYCRGWQEWSGQNIAKTIAAEYLAVCHKVRTVGMVDFIGEMLDGTLCLADYKTRQCDGEGKFYDKDLMQLAVEARIIKEGRGLDYWPRCFSVCIDSNGGSTFVKEWKTEKVVLADWQFGKLSAAYDAMNGFLKMEDEQ